MTASSVITTWPGAITVSIITICITVAILGFIYLTQPRFEETYEEVNNER